MEERRDRKGNLHGKREGILEQKFYTKKRVQPIGKPHEKFLQMDEIEQYLQQGIGSKFGQLI